MQRLSFLGGGNMGLNDLVSAERVHIGFFGMRNAGKSSVVNAITNQTVSIVSSIPGTTTDPVKKTMEILPIGPTVIIDTPGIDDEGYLGEMRVKKTKQVLASIDVAVLVVDVNLGLRRFDKELISEFISRDIPYIVAYNKCDITDFEYTKDENCIYVSALTGKNISELRMQIARIKKNVDKEKNIVFDIMNKEDIAILVTPIDASAPKGRLILPQQMVIREIVENGGIAIVCQINELKRVLYSMSIKPHIVITDSQVFEEVSKVVPNDILLTSFSILFARYKGNLKEFVSGAKQLEELKDGDKILISEGCTHHRQCEDIGTVKIPRWISNYTNKKLNFDFSSGSGFPEDLSQYNLIVHCGGCMLNENEMKRRISIAKENSIPITNYGIIIAYMKGILKRSIEMF